MTEPVFTAHKVCPKCKQSFLLYSRHAKICPACRVKKCVCCGAEFTVKEIARLTQVFCGNACKKATLYDV
jgi:hypothetical protein